MTSDTNQTDEKYEKLILQVDSEIKHVETIFLRSLNPIFLVITAFYVFLKFDDPSVLGIFYSLVIFTVPLFLCAMPFFLRMGRLQKFRRQVCNRTLRTAYTLKCDTRNFHRVTFPRKTPNQILLKRLNSIQYHRVLIGLCSIVLFSVSIKLNNSWIFICAFILFIVCIFPEQTIGKAIYFYSEGDFFVTNVFFAIFSIFLLAITIAVLPVFTSSSDLTCSRTYASITKGSMWPNIFLTTAQGRTFGVLELPQQEMPRTLSSHLSISGYAIGTTIYCFSSAHRSSGFPLASIYSFVPKAVSTHLPAVKQARRVVHQSQDPVVAAGP